MRPLNKPLLLTSAAISLAVAGAAHAQSISQPTPPEHYALDPRGVDMVSGYFNFQTTEVAIGQPDGGGLNLTRGRIQLGWRDSNQGSLQVSGSTYTVALGLESEVFTLSGGVFTPASNSGATLSQSGTTFTFTTSSGTVAKYSTTYCYTSTGAACTNRAALYEIVVPNGESTNYHYVTQTYVRSTNPLVTGTVVRLQSITNNHGYQLHYVYKSNVMTGTAPLNTRVANWLAVASVTGVNNAVDYCAPTGFSCTYSRTWPSIAYTSTVGGPITAATDQSGRVTQYLYGTTGADLTGIRYPGSTANDITVAEGGVSGQVTSLTDATGSWTYSFTDVGVTRTAVSTGPNGQSLTVVTDLTVGRPSTVTNALGETTGFQYDSQERLTRTTNPEGDYVEQTLDARGNVTLVTATPKPGSGLSPVSFSSTFASTCTNPVTCNLPITTTDALGNITDYTWDSTHGGLLTTTLPAPATGADRPQTRVAYATQTAYYKNSSGTIVAASSSVTLPVEVSACATGTSCANAANEVRTTLVYGSTGVANNLLPTSVSRGSGTSPAMAVTAITYTPDGDVATVDMPLAGTDDMTMYRYDNARQVVGVVGPDPDGGGAGLNRAQRYTYDLRGEVTLAEAGTTPGYTDPNWASFASLVRTGVTYDAQGRPLTASQESGTGTVVSVQQVSYDAAGRLDCTAVRMNPATFGSLPGSACTAATPGSDGPDRISQTTYDAAGRPLTTTLALGLAEAITETISYTDNGQIASLTDGEGNVSIQEYDGFDRPSKLRYPCPAGGGTSPCPAGGGTWTTDDEEVGYDDSSNVVSARNRAGQTTTVAYDDLHRPTLIDAPSGTMDVALTYDNLGRVLTSTGNSQTLTNAWDPLSGLTSETGPLGAMGYQRDATGRVTRITWPDNFYVSYEHDLYGAVTAIRENGAASGPGVLATYGYNNQGQPTAITRGNGATTAWVYDSFARMTSLDHDVSGSGDDLTFDYSWNAASQIASRIVSNPAYVFAPVTGSTAYQNDGLNRVTDIASASVTYDANENITAALGSSFSFDAANRLSGTASTSYGYDPADRLFSSSAAGVRFQYAGQQLVGEYNSSGVLTARHVPGAGLDGVVTSYAGSGTTNRTWLIADERRSVINLSDGSAATLAINRYDEYGAPASGAAGRFRYTGQQWLPEAGAYHYRARTYLPGVGRFLQTDPVGYTAGANLYAYVGADPVNRIDPWGLDPDTLPDVIVNGFRCGPNRPIKCGRSTAGNVPFLNERRGASGAMNPSDPISELDEVVVTGTRVKPARLMPLAVSQALASSDPDGPDGRDDCTASDDMLPSGEDFSAACRAHDNCWGTLYADQYTCDRQFLARMREACTRPESAPSCRATALRYYTFVRFMGPIFSYEQRRAQRRQRERLGY